MLLIFTAPNAPVSTVESLGASALAHSLLPVPRFTEHSHPEAGLRWLTASGSLAHRVLCNTKSGIAQEKSVELISKSERIAFEKSWPELV